MENLEKGHRLCLRLVKTGQRAMKYENNLSSPQKLIPYPSLKSLEQFNCSKPSGPVPKWIRHLTCYKKLKQASSNPEHAISISDAASAHDGLRRFKNDVRNLRGNC
jgi:hypothetical protein